MHDVDIRKPLLDRITLEQQENHEALIISELGLCGTSRVDIAVLTDFLTGYEIKSDLDTLERLPRQAETYNKILDYAEIVTCENHLEGILRIVPEWWGITLAYEQYQDIRFLPYRESRQNPNVDPRSLVELMWREETYEVLESHGLHWGIKTKPRSVLWDRLADAFALEELRPIVLQRLKARSNWRVGRSET